ncbi:MAG: peptide transporter, partial [Rhizobacter sp.]|nr:peptide transporter [Rhizobacter sp.]
TLVSAERKDFTDKEGISGFESKKHSNELRLGITGDFRDDVFSGGVSTYDLNGTVGRVTYDSAAPAATDDDRNFRKVGLGYSRLQNLVTGSLLLYVNYRGQIAFNNLDSTQQFRLGGADGVRAFAPGEGNGDSGHIITTELRFLPPTSFFGPVSRELVFAVFYDWGRVRLRDDPSQRGPAFINHQTLAGHGVSLAWERPRSFNFRIHIAERSVGHQTGDPVMRTPRIYAEFSKRM